MRDENQKGMGFVKRKGKLCLFIIGFVAIAMNTMEPFSYAFFGSGKKINALSNPKPSFNLYEKIMIDDTPYTIISDGSVIKMLSDTTEGNANAWTTANANIKNIFTDGNIGTLGGPIFRTAVSLPTSADLTANITGNTLNASVPKVNGNWWLGDISSNNRSKYMTSDNTNNGVNKITQSATITDNGNGTHSCGTTTANETGVFPTTAYTSNPASAQIAVAKTMSGTISYDSGNSSIVNLTQYKSSSCLVSEGTQNIYMTYNTWVDPNTVYTWSYDYINDKVSTDTYPPVQRVVSLLTSYKSGDAAKETFKKLFKSAEKGTIIVGVIRSNGCNSIKDADHPVASWNGLRNNTGADMQFNLTVTKTNVTYETHTCAGSVNNAGAALTRPMLTLSLEDIAYANTERRTFTPSISLNENILESDISSGSKYLTMKDKSSSVSLKSGADGVSGSDFYVPMNDNTIDVPVQIKGNADGKRYISASATDKNGNEVYSVLKKVSGSEDTVTLDISNLIDTNTADSFDLKLYVENAGVSDVSYITEGTDITVHNIKDQNIDFDADQKNAYEYGDTFTITSHLNDVAQGQAATKINYSLSSNPDNAASIISQSYNENDGTASVQLKANMGSRTIILAIDKAEGIGYNAAEQKTMTIQLNKKKINVHPTVPTRKYVQGEAIPAFAPISDKGDSLPEELIPELIPMEGSPPSPGDDAGKVTAEGKWKLVYSDTILNELNNEALLRDYDITLQDYDDDPSYVFETGHVVPPDDWLSITPAPNVDGWNTTDVIIKPSDKAKEEGFTKITMNDGTQADSVIITSDTSSDDASFIFYNETGGYTDAINLSQDIKIDRTKPEMVIDVKKIEVTPAMKFLNTLTGGIFYKGGFIVTVTAQDAESDIKTITSPNGSGTITTDGTFKKLEFTIHDDFKDTISATVTNKAGLSTTETTKKIINENNNTGMKIEITKISIPDDRTKPQGSKLEFDAAANQSGLKNVSYSVSGGEEIILKSYTAADAEDENITLRESLTLPLEDIISYSDPSAYHIPITLKVTTNSENTITKDVDICLDTVKPAITVTGIADETVWAPKTGKKVDFKVIEEDSGIDTLTVTKPDSTKAVIGGELTGSNFSFIADMAGSYTIDVKDKAGNTAQLIKVITKIDPDLPVISDITKNPDDQNWSKLDKTISFNVKDDVNAESGSGVKKESITITRRSGTSIPALTCTGNSDDISCSFTATENDIYTVSAEDAAGNIAEQNTIKIGKIDKEAPDITDIEVVQNPDPFQFDTTVTISFKAAEKSATGASGIADNGVGFILEGTDKPLTASNDVYTVTVEKGAVYTIYAKDKAGNQTTKEITVGYPEIHAEPTDLDVYAGDELDLMIKAELHDTDHKGRIYNWYLVNEAGTYTSLKSGILPETEEDQVIPFPYARVDGSQSGYYLCLITNGDDIYTWSTGFQLNVLGDPVNGYVMIPSKLELKKLQDGSETAQTEFDIGLSDIAQDTAKPKKEYHILAVPEIILQNAAGSDAYTAALYKKINESYELYRTGDLATLSYTGTKTQKVKLVTPVNLYREQGRYQGTLHFTIHYGEGGADP